jgi:hypothetical protein
MSVAPLARASPGSGAEAGLYLLLPRHLGAACRELDQAIERFMYLKKNKI